MRARLIAAGLLAGCLALGAAAQTEGIDEDALFGGDSTAPANSAAPGSAAALPGSDAAADDRLFDNAVAVSAAPTTSTYEEKFLKSEPVRIGGQYSFSIAAGIDWFKDYADWTPEYFFSGPLTLQKDDPEDTVNPAGSKRQVTYANPEKREDSSLNLSGNLWFSARPTADLRLFGKATFAFPFGIDAASLDGYKAMVDTMAAGGSWSQVQAQAAGAGVTLPNIKIWEFYSDFAVDDKAFFRVGKQMVKWGVGYFFQPADVISLSAVDVNNPRADREGPLAVKANIPIDVHNLDFYLIAPGGSNLESVLDLKPAARFQAVLGAWEFGLGATIDGGKNKATVLKDGTIQYDRDVQAKFIATASGAIWDFNVFGEALVQRYQPGLYLNDTAYSFDSIIDIDKMALFNSTPTGFQTGANGFPDFTKPIFETGTNRFTHSVSVNRDQWTMSGTAGLSYSNSDAYFNGLLQYFYNGTGYDNLGSTVSDALRYIKAAGVPGYDPQAGKVTVADLYALAMGYTGKHYLGVNLGESFAKNSKVSAGTFLMWNISDLSGFVRPSVSIKLTDQINLGLNSTIYFGADNTQFRGIKRALVDAGFGEDFGNGFQQPRFKLGLTLDMGSGAF
jgi:hypothetical protein